MTVAPSPALSAPARTSGPTFLPLVLFLFLGSGCSALIYEIVWFQLLEFSIGSSAISIGVLLATFMGGLCLGSLLFSRVFSTRHHPLKIYALLELGVGIFGILITLSMPAFESFYAAIAHGNPSILLRALISAAALLPPTLFMGATLPAISRWIEATPRGLSWLGFFYGGNTVGAVLGCLLAGFYLLPTFEKSSTATYVAAAINLAVAIVGFALSVAAPHTPPAESVVQKTTVPTPPIDVSNVQVYFSIALSGMAALGAEVIWTRLLSLLLGLTTYTFSIILAVFLAGLGIGSTVGAVLTRNGVNPRMALAWCQMLCAASIAWAAYFVTNGLSSWPIDPSLALQPHFRFELDLARCCWAILPPTLFWGASFPLALAAVAGKNVGGDSAKAVGRVYAANTVGAIIGALFFSLIAVKAWGTQGSQNVLVGIAGFSAVLAALSTLSPEAGQTHAAFMKRFISTQVVVLMALCVSVLTIVILVHYELAQVPWRLIAYGRAMTSMNWRAPENNGRSAVYVGEGLTSSVAVTRNGPDELNFHVAGKVEASTLTQDMRLQLMLGHYPALFHNAPKKVLIVGCGAGVTAGSFIIQPGIEKIVICEIEPLVPQVVAEYFGPQNNDVVKKKDDGKFIDDRVQVVYDDARHYILTTDEKFDIITSDPIHPWVKGAASLYTQEYFELVKKHLNPGGIVTQWVPLYESNTAVVKSEVKTFFEAFPNGTVWKNDVNGGGYDVILMGGNEPLLVDSTTLQNRLNRPLIRAAMSKVGLGTALDIFKTYGGNASDLKDWTDAPDGVINHDANLRLQYLAGEALEDDEANLIRDQIVSYRKFPEGMFKLTPDQHKALEEDFSKRLP